MNVSLLNRGEEFLYFTSLLSNFNPVTSTQKCFLGQWVFSSNFKDEQDYTEAMSTGLKNGCGKMGVGSSEVGCEGQA